MRVVILLLFCLITIFAQEAVIPNSSPESEQITTEDLADTETSEPEPAIKFDNIEDEDYGDSGVAQENQFPDELDDSVINELVNTFLETGSIEDAKKKAYANPALKELKENSDYWKTENVKAAGSIKEASAAKAWVDGYQVEAQKIMEEVAKCNWKYVINAGNATKRGIDEAEDAIAYFVRSTSLQAKQFDKSVISDADILRQLEFISFEGMSALSPEDYTAYNKAAAKVNQIATTATVCDKDDATNCKLTRDDLPSIFANEKDASRLSHLWMNYLTKITDAKHGYSDFVKFSSKGAQVNGFSDAGAMWRSGFDLSTKTKKPVMDFNQQIQNVYDKIEPFYKELHAYMRRQIAGMYQNAEGLSKDGPIPAHLFGSLDGGDWSSHYEQTKPYPDEDDLASDLLTSFRTQNYTAKGMFKKAYRYFKSAGFPHLPKTYWTSSFFERVWSKNMICDPAATIDMRDGQDFRVKACAKLNKPDFEMVHSLLAQTFYQYLYRDQPFIFREKASASIGDAISNVFAHLATNVDYLYSQKLISSEHLDIKDTTTVNRLYKEALSNIAKIPFNTVADNWRYELFEGKISSDSSNDRWWQLRKKFEGISSPAPSNSSNMDSLMHTTINQIHSPASKGIVSQVVQFQILKSICPEGVILSDGCVLSEETTEKLRKTMALGSSITWIKALEMITGSSEIDPRPLLEYYEPLIDWLRNTNEITGVYVGWDGEGTEFSPDDIPQPREASSGSGIISADSISYPGGDCSHGEDCLLESTCNGTVCVCNEGLYTLEFGDVISCVATDPAKSPFGDYIDIVPAETTEAPVTTTRRPKRVKASAGLQLVSSIAIIFTTMLVL